MDEIFVWLVICVVVVAALYGVGVLIDKYICVSRAELMAVPVHYDIVSGCMVKMDNGRWIPLDAYYYREGE